MAKPAALSNRQRRKVAKAKPSKPRVHAAVVAVMPAEPKGMAARVQMVEELAERERMRIGLDLALAVALGNTTPGMAEEDFGVSDQVGNEVILTDRGVAGRSTLTIRGRDGLVALHESGALTDLQAKAGLAYRYCYENVPQGLGSSLGNLDGGRGGRDWTRLDLAINEDGKLIHTLSAFGLHRAYVSLRLEQIERAVIAAAVDGRELDALRAIAGAGDSVRDLAGSGGHAKAAYRRALARALQVTAEVLRIAAQ